MSEPITPTPPASPRDIIAGIFSDGPTWAKIIVAVALLLAGAVGQRCAHTDPTPPPVNVNVQPPAAPPAPVMVNATPRPCECSAPRPCECAPKIDPQPVEGVRDGRGIVTDQMRRRVARQLERDGYRLAGGDATPLDREAAEKRAALLTDGVVIETGRQIGAIEQIGDGTGRPVLDFLRSILQWVREHPEQVERWLRLLLSLLMFL